MNSTFSKEACPRTPRVDMHSTYTIATPLFINSISNLYLDFLVITKSHPRELQNVTDLIALYMDEKLVIMDTYLIKIKGAVLVNKHVFKTQHDLFLQQEKTFYNPQ